MLNAGKLRHRVVIQQAVETQDSNTGAINVVWQDVATVWAAIEPLSAREFIAAQAEDSSITTRITIRYRRDISAKMRLHHRAKNVFYDIHGILSDKNSGLEYITLPCSEGLKYSSEPDELGEFSHAFSSAFFGGSGGEQPTGFSTAYSEAFS